MGFLDEKYKALLFSPVTLVVLNQFCTFFNSSTHKCPPFEYRQPTLETGL